MNKKKDEEEGEACNLSHKVLDIPNETDEQWRNLCRGGHDQSYILRDCLTVLRTQKKAIWEVKGPEKKFFYKSKQKIAVSYSE